MSYGVRISMDGKMQQPQNTLKPNNNWSTMVKQAEDFRKQQVNVGNLTEQTRPAQQRAPQAGVERVVGHPWVSALRSTPQYQWDIPAPGACDEHLEHVMSTWSM